jgi:hypothetical protein
MAANALYVPKKEPHVLIIGKLTMEEVKPPPKLAPIVCLTDTYLLKGSFHMGMDTKVVDVFSVLAGPFFFASNLKIVSLYADALSVHAAAGLAYVHRDAIRSFYVPDEESGQIGHSNRNTDGLTAETQKRREKIFFSLCSASPR